MAVASAEAASDKRDISVCSVNRTALGSRRAAALAALRTRSAHLKTLRASRCNFGASEASLLLAALDSGAELEQIEFTRLRCPRRAWRSSMCAPSVSAT